MKKVDQSQRGCFLNVLFFPQHKGTQFAVIEKNIFTFKKLKSENSDLFFFKKNKKNTETN